MQKDESKTFGGKVYKSAKIAFIQNYILIMAIIVLSLLLIPLYDLLYYSDVPLAIFIWAGFGLIISVLLDQPAVERMFRRYVLTDIDVIKYDGVVRKRIFSIPIQSIGEIKVRQGFFGRFFNFGDVEVTGFKESIVIKGILYPQEVHEIIQERMREMVKGLHQPHQQPKEKA